MNRRAFLLTGLAAPLAGCATPSRVADLDSLRRQVTDTEIAFANTMADRDYAAFVGFIAEEAVFLNGGKPLRGRPAIAEHWKRFYAETTAPFSWKPDLVEVLPSGTLAQSVGPVMNPSGVVVARFNSVWRLEGSGVWRVIFDSGCEVCNGDRKQASNALPPSPLGGGFHAQLA
jgi:ketosteroid isomerase-like protein